MSKICDRNYGDGTSMLSVKVIDGIPCCPSCEKPTYCHGQPVEIRALHWSIMGDYGSSSLAIARHMVGIGQYIKFNPVSMMPPSDAGDRGRCIRLLELIPEWIERLPEMLKYDALKPEAGIVINSMGIGAYDNSWSKQIPLIMQEGKL